jgi:hypothetical protein
MKAFLLSLQAQIDSAATVVRRMVFYRDGLALAQDRLLLNRRIRIF